MTWDHSRGYDCVVVASEAYEAKTGVRIERVKRSLQAFADAPIQKIAERSDFIILDHPHVGQVSQKVPYCLCRSMNIRRRRSEDRPKATSGMASAGLTLSMLPVR